MTVICLLPAAGMSSRMRGGDKLLEPVNGVPCLAAMAQRAIAAGLDVLITLPAHDHPREAVLNGLDLQIYRVPDPSEGMAASLRLAAKTVGNRASGMMILPPDMPAIDVNDLRKISDAFLTTPSKIVQASTSNGIPGHPVVFPKHILPEFAKLSGDRGAADIVKTYKADVIYVSLEGNRARLDLDTPEDWANWRASSL